MRLMFSLLNSNATATPTVIARERLENAMAERPFPISGRFADARRLLRLFIMLTALLGLATSPYHFVARHSGKCLSAAATPDNSIQLTQRRCDGSGVQSFQLTAQ